METTWLKKGMTISLSLAVLLLSGCEFSLNGISGNDKVPRPDETTPVEQPIKDDATKTVTGIAPYYANGDIEYYGEPKKMDNSFLDLVEQDPGYKALKESLVAHYSVTMWGDSQPTKATTWEEIDHFFRFYEVGTIKAETYKNQKLVILDLECDGPCFAPMLYKFAYDPTKNKLTYLKRHSNDYTAPMMEILTYTTKPNNTVFYKGIEPSETIKISNSTKVLELQTAHNSYLPEDLTSDKLVFSDNQTGDLYAQTGSGCLRLKAPDGSTSLYGFNPHFFDSETITATWNDNSPQTNITDKYAYMAGGCGITGNCYLSLPELKDDQLTLIGKSSNGIDLYGVKNAIEGSSIATQKESGINPAKSTAQLDFDNYYQIYKSMYEYSDKTTPLMTFQEFIDRKAVIYWKDPFGRWTGIVRSDIKPAAECGKPVIYLYPEKTTDVSVQVDVDKFTKTIPEYGKTGWTVKADPNGTLYNYADQQTYPYLFWEGQESKGVNPTQGFSVKRANLETFLDESLTKLGLNSTELKNFKDFWLPRMLENNEQYFMISFLGTSEFNKIAPLTITPAPQTLIRVFMYYHPTNTNYELTPQKLTTLPRKGFTVLEWGGTSSTPWQY